MMVLKTEWVQLETIELKSESAINRQDNESANTANNDNKQLNTAIVGSVNNNNINIIKSASGNPSSGFGFGITGNKSTGVVVKAITIGGSAHKDGRLKINDQIYQIGDVNVRSMSSEQVAAVLRQSALHDKSVKFIVARPVQHISVDLIDKSKSNDKSNLDDCTGLNRNLIDLNNLNSNQECFFILTNEIMDKNVDLKQRLKFEMDKRKSFKTQNTTNENVQDIKLEIKDDLVEAKEEEEEEMLESSCYLIELIKQTEKTALKLDSNANINEMIIQNLKINYSIQISIETIESINYLIVIDDILMNSNEFYEQFDQIIQIEKYKCDYTLFTLDRVILDQLFQADKLKLKLKKNFHLKQTKLSEKWKNILKKSDNNNDYEMVISQIDKKASKGLGISLEGTVDIDAYGNETCCHHYIRSIMSNGTVDQSIQMKFQPMDELLQIDSFKLYAINYLDLLNILKNLNNKLLTFVCARKIKTNVIIQLPTPATALPPPPPSPPPKPLDLPKEPSLEPPPPPPLTINNSKSKEKIAFPNLIRSRSLELSNLAMWSKHIHYINLIKGPNGLGFSLIDYQQDPIIKPFSKSIIVIRALVANGVSQLDGRLMPGQRLISINDFDLNADTKNDLLKLTVNYLKSLPVGESVRLGIQKPLPFPIINADTNSNKKSTKSTLNLTTTSLIKTTEPIVRKKIKTITTSHYNLESTLSTSEKQIITTSSSSSSSSDSNSNNSIDDSESSTLDSFNKTKKNNYCLAAISAPSLLTSNSQEQSNDDILLSSKRSNKTHLFYSSSSLAKLEKESLLNKLDDIKIRKSSNSLNISSNNNNNKQKSINNNTEEDDLLFDKNNFLNFQIMPTLALEEEEIVETLISFDDNNTLKKPNKLQISNVDTSAIINNVSDSVVLLNFLVNTKKLNNNKKSKLHNIQLIDNSDDNEDIEVEEEEEEENNDDNDDRNKHLITEEQFNQAFIINTNKKLKTLKEQNSFNSYELTDETKVVATVAVEEEDEDFSDLIIIKQHENNETSLENIKNLNLKEMVKEMATFNWPQLANNSQTPTDNNNNKEITQILEINVEKTEPIKTAAVVATTTKLSLSSSSRYRSTSASRSIHCSGGFITTPDNLRRRKRFLKVKKKYCSAHGSRDMSSLTISGNNNNNNNTTNNTSLLLNLSKNSFNVRSRSSSVKIINILGKEIIKLPLCLEREIKIKKEFKTLGISLVDSNVDEGVNGCCIVKIEKNSACFNDARLQVGDYLIAINNEHLRNVSNSSARAILNRATLTSSEYLLVVFIPLNDALQYVEQFNKIHGSSFKLSNSSKNISPISSTAAIKTKNGRKIGKTLKKISKLKSPSSTSVSSTRSSSSNSSISSIDSSSSSSSSLSSTCSCSNNKKHLNLSKFSLSLDISKKSTNHSKTGNNNNNNNTNNSKNLTKSLQSIENMNNTIQTSKSKDNITTINNNNNNNNNNNKETDVWGPIRTIVLERAQNNTSLGISIVGGKFELNNNAQPMNGIFIKHVSDKSVASQNGQIKIGDRIISVNDFDLTNVTHEKAVEIIRSALSPVKFVIQSLISSSSLSSKSDGDLDNIHNDQNNKYQYSLKMINKKYAFLLDPDSSNTTNNKLYIFRIKRTNLTESLGLGLTGNSDPNKTSVFVCNIYKDSVAEQHDLFKVGDQILEINGHCVYGRSHSNVTPLIRSIKELEIYFIVLRNKDYLNEMFIPSNKEPNNNETIIISDPTPLSSIATATTTNEENKEIQLKRVTFDKPCKQVKLSKGVTGFGIAICEDRFHRLIVRGLNPNGVAYQDGRIEIGDEIIAINDVKISSLNYDEIMNKLHTTLEPVEFTLIKPERLATTTTEDSSPSKLNTPVKQTPIQQEAEAAASPPLPPPLSPQTQTKSPIKQSSIIKKTTTTNSNDPKTNKIKMGEETLIEIERGKLGLGLSIVGGFDTQLPGIIIHDIYQNGAAFLDKRLTIGDQILKVNNIDLTNATHEQALNALRQTSDSVRLLIHRGFINTNQSIIPPTSTDTCSVNTFGVRLKSNNEDININKYLDGVSNYEDEKLLNILSIDLNKKFAKGLGFSIIGRRTGGSTDASGVFISHIIEGGCAHKDGRLMVDDLILEVNGQDIRKSSYNNVAFLLKTLPQGKVNLKIGRLKLSTSNSIQNSQNTSKQGSRRGSFIFGSKN